MDLKAFAFSLMDILQEFEELSLSKSSFVTQTLSKNLQSFMGLFLQYQGQPAISSKELARLFGPQAVRILVQNKKHFTLSDLCGFLDLSERDINTNQGRIEPDTRYEFEELLEQASMIYQKVRRLFSDEVITDPERLFTEIDFFSNGYITGNQLMEFLNNQLKASGEGGSKQDRNAHRQLEKQDTIESHCCEIIAYLRNSSVAQKMFYTDFLQVIQENTMELQTSTNGSQIDERSNRLGRNKTFALSELGKNRAGCIAKTNQLLNSKCRKREVKIGVGNRSRIGTTYGQSQTFDNQSHVVSRIKTQQLLERDSQVGRDQKYIQQALRKTRERVQRAQRISEGDHHHSGEQKNSLTTTSDFKGRSVQTISSNFKGYPVQTINSNFKAALQPVQENSPSATSYQNKISTSHPRNQRYLAKISKELEIVNLPVTNSHCGLSPLNTLYPIPTGRSAKHKASEITYQLKYISQIYIKHQKYVCEFLSANPKFTFVNGFNVIDWREKQVVSYKDLLEFVVDANLNIHQNKIKNMYGYLAKARAGGFRYSDYVERIFRLRVLEDSYFNECRKRKHLFTEKWTNKSKREYCAFIRNIINLFQELCESKRLLCSMMEVPISNDKVSTFGQVQEQLKHNFNATFDSEDLDKEKLADILGSGSECFINEICKKCSVIGLEEFYDFMTDF